MFFVRLKKRGDRPKHVLPQYLKKQLREHDNAATQENKSNALIRLASHCGDASVLGADRIMELMMGEGRSLTNAESSSILAQAFEFIGKGDRCIDIKQ